MSAQVTVTLPDDVLRRAELLALRTGRPVGDLLAETIELSLQPLGTPSGNPVAIESWTDAQVLAAADAEMSPAEDRRLSELLDRQQADALGAEEHAELAALMDRYQQGLLCKAQALREAVRRGLRAALQP
jgi:hypothetical protein